MIFPKREYDYMVVGEYFKDSNDKLLPKPTYYQVWDMTVDQAWYMTAGIFAESSKLQRRELRKDYGDGLIVFETLGECVMWLAMHGVTLEEVYFGYPYLDHEDQAEFERMMRDGQW